MIFLALLIALQTDNQVQSSNHLEFAHSIPEPTLHQSKTASKPKQASPPTEIKGPDKTIIKMPVRFIQIADSNGNAFFFENPNTKEERESGRKLTTNELRLMIEKVNRTFVQAGIEFVPLLDEPIPVIKNSALFWGYSASSKLDVTNPDIKPQADDFGETFAPWAFTNEPGILVVLRRGMWEWQWNNNLGRWISSRGPGRGLSHCIQWPFGPDMAGYGLSHEFGHLLGLPHTFTRGDLKTIDEVQSAIDQFRVEHPDRNPLEAIDGDLNIGILDSSPDPGEKFWSLGYYQDTIKLRLNSTQPQDVFIDKVNVMGYGGGLWFYNQQVALMRRTLAFWKESGNRFPRNIVPLSANKSIILPVSSTNVQSNSKLQIENGRFPSLYGGQPFVAVSLPPGKSMDIKIPFRVVSGRYRIWLLGTRSIDHGQFDLQVKNSQSSSLCSKTINLWSGTIPNAFTRLPSGPILLGEANLTESSIIVNITGLEKISQSMGTTFGIEGLIIQKIETN